ncbi:RlpA-like double-psi beta-barrel-protein domain-containing protein-containing protein [Aspergillus parasiticus]|uniref:RlpA-like double-psi beta-barrel-protein domain-containing protein-containing protein n=1 Tax=Aspergillus parasiticus TaxID=5067 RepID=A0A5N6D7W8_ASPPA|nr:RlpA-like double-psi beta-barrel-protein domain-containing protein-containing protein [Aspergillus parasiticus]
MKFAVFTASSILTISFAQEKATFTLYGEGDTRGSPNCATNVNVCGQPNQSGITAALSQAQYGLAPGQGTSPDCGTCWKITITSDLSGNPVEEKTAKITVNNFCPMYSNPICNTPNEYDDGIHFDLCTETSAESFLTFGTGIGTERQVSC